jgi:hypothetical protein
MEKVEIRKEIIKFLEQTPYTQASAIRYHVESIMKERGEIGVKTTGDQFQRFTTEVPISDSDALFISEVIYDLLAERIITPGVDRSNLKWPFLHVSNMERLKQKLQQ